jgi:protease-4
VAKIKEWLIGSLIALVTLILTLILVNYISRRQSNSAFILSSGGKKVAVIELMGTIYDSRRIVRQFKFYGEQESIKAIVFRVESPGGLVAPAQEIYKAASRVRDKGKPVVVSMGSVAASGGYYVACGADTIMASPGTTTGSIGVIAEFPNLKGLFDKIGVKFEIVKSGRYKDTGSPHRDMTTSDRIYLQSWVNDAHSQFVETVVQERKLSIEHVKKLADGKVFTGKQAMELGLVDILGDYEDAIQLAADLGGIQGKPEIVKERRRRVSLFDLVLEQMEGYIRGISGFKLMYRL